jgi:hypothetical protein
VESENQRKRRVDILVLAKIGFRQLEVGNPSSIDFQSTEMTDYTGQQEEVLFTEFV